MECVNPFRVSLVMTAVIFDRPVLTVDQKKTHGRSARIAQRRGKQRASALRAMDALNVFSLVGVGRGARFYAAIAMVGIRARSRTRSIGPPGDASRRAPRRESLRDRAVGISNSTSRSPRPATLLEAPIRSPALQCDLAHRPGSSSPLDRSTASDAVTMVTPALGRPSA
jgi:hypothetical protein